MTELLQCYNKGCCQKFSAAENCDTACTYHPGNPIFHDAKQKWSCCGKYSTDFSVFLSLKGCVTGRHSDVKPVEVKPDQTIKEDLMKDTESKPAEPVPHFERPGSDAATVKLKTVVASSLQTVLDKLKATETSEEKVEQEKVELGTSCKNSSCKTTYEGPASDASVCQYHSGVAIFHEGAKFWTCCQRKTSDFDAFLAQEGCTTGKHNWTKEDALAHNLALSTVDHQCRHDFFQMANSVTVNIYAKCVLPDTVTITANQVKLEVDFRFEGGKKMFKRTFILFDIIDPAQSTVKLLGTKVEIILRKGRACSWSKLEFTQPVADVGDNNNN